MLGRKLSKLLFQKGANMSERIRRSDYGFCTYNIWQAMRDRCLNKNNPYYKNYGGRGITICERWDSYANFKQDMGERPYRYTLERKDNNRGYSKRNCRWATYLEQNRNKRNTKLNIYKAMMIIRARMRTPKLKITELTELYNVSTTTIFRVLSGHQWPEAQSLAKRSKYNFDGLS